MARRRDPEEVLEWASSHLDRLPLLAPLAQGLRDGRAARDARRRRAERRRRRIVRRLLIMIAVIVLATVATTVLAWLVAPVGVGGWLLITLLTFLVCLAVGLWPVADAPPPTKLATAKPTVLPAQVDAWLDTKRRALPALAAPKVDAISAQLAALAPQLAAVPPGDPTALELNRLLGKHLPELVDRYEKVAPAQRKVAAMPGGPTIERQLVDGLGLIEAELARVNDDLGRADRDAFAVQGKFLETRYGKDGTLS
jgi:hypothetical protein